MKTCLACGAQFPVRVVIDGKLRSLYGRRFCLECSPFGAHNTSNVPVGSMPPNVLMELRRKKRNAKTYRSQKRRRSRRRQDLIASAGGHCQDCGYVGPALEFHHRDPSTKEFSVGEFNGSLTRLLAEAAKCDLLCANCHRLRHALREASESVDAVTRHRRNRKLRAVAYMGSVCEGCGRGGHSSLFEFHHWNADEKDFGLSEHGIPHSWERTVAELAKCVMLCANCHREVHAGVRTIDRTGLAEEAALYAA